jgi:hypothetical protein
MAAKQTPQQLLVRAIKAGATFSDFMTVYAEHRKDDPTHEDEIIAAAREQWHEDGKIEIDDNTICSGSSGAGDYVLAWVWADFDKS